MRIDNSNFLAAQTYHRHQVPDASYTNYDQFRGADGKPIYPQRKMLLGPLFAAGAAGDCAERALQRQDHHGRIRCSTARPCPIRQTGIGGGSTALYGKDAPNKYRLWYTENALHGANEDKDASTRVVTYLPMLQQALRDVSAWVEKGTPPPANTSYRVADGQIVVARDGRRRGAASSRW